MTLLWPVFNARNISAAKQWDSAKEKKKKRARIFKAVKQPGLGNLGF